LFSINRVVGAFFLQGVVYIVIMSLMQGIINKPLTNNMAIFVVYFMLFLPNIIYAVITEIMQSYIKNYMLFGLVIATMGIGILLVDNAIFGISTIKKEAIFGYFITYFIISVYLKYLYKKEDKKYWRYNE